MLSLPPAYRLQTLLLQKRGDLFPPSEELRKGKSSEDLEDLLNDGDLPKAQGVRKGTKAMSVDTVTMGATPRSGLVYSFLVLDKDNSTTGLCGGKVSQSDHMESFCMKRPRIVL